MYKLGLITARGGSKGLARKNVLPVAGKPLIAWSIGAALKGHGLSRVIVTTDDEEIAQVARAWGAEVPFVRPPKLARDDSDHVSVVEHAIHWLEAHDNARPDYVMLLQPTSPLRTAEDIEGVIQIAHARGAIAVVSVCETRSHPCLAKRILEDGTLSDFVTSDIAYLQRQVLPPAYALNGAIYLNRSEAFLRQRTFLPPGTHAYVMPPERSLDVDSAWDLHLADLILRDRHESKSS